MCLLSWRKISFIYTSKVSELYFGHYLLIFVLQGSPQMLGFFSNIVCRERWNLRISCGLEERPWSTIMIHFFVVVVNIRTFSQKRLPKTAYCDHRKAEWPGCQTNLVNPHFIMRCLQFALSTRVFCSTGPSQVNTTHLSNPNARCFFHTFASHTFCSTGPLQTNTAQVSNPYAR